MVSREEFREFFTEATTSDPDGIIDIHSLIVEHVKTGHENMLDALLFALALNELCLRLELFLFDAIPLDKQKQLPEMELAMSLEELLNAFKNTMTAEEENE